MEIRRVGVVGCGLMGSGIIEVSARAGYEVIVREINDEILEKGVDRVRKSMGRAVDRGKMEQGDMDVAMGRISGTVELADFSDCDLVIEAAIENMDVKKDIFTQLDEITPASIVLASNTSSLSITEIGSVTQRPDKVVGMHFFNPVPVLPLLEVVRGFQTSEETLQIAREFGKSVGKTIVVAEKDNPGFIVNLLFVPYGLDSIRALENGVASKEDIDMAMKLGMNHPMGPFTLMDFVGLDTMLYVADAMYEEYRDPRYAAPPLLRRMVTAGYLGRKTGKGFYEY
ncbi:MAG: 3-hydroxyacyl-CoA dehydrogenase family protein [Anaerolineae bacterium]